MISNLKNRVKDFGKEKEVKPRMKICRVIRQGNIVFSVLTEDSDDIISYIEAKEMYGELLLPMERIVENKNFEHLPMSIVSVSSKPVWIHGKLLTEAQLKTLEEGVKEEIHRDYVSQKKEIIASIPSDTDNFDKIRRVFDWFVDNVFYWDNHPNSSFGVEGVKFSWKKNGLPSRFGVDYNTKEGALLLRKSVCMGMSEAFQDILCDMGIQVETVSNKTHVWNMFYTTYGPLFIDLSQSVRHIHDFNDLSWYYYTRETAKDRYRYFAKTLEDLNCDFPNYPHGNPSFVPTVKTTTKIIKK